MILTADEFCTDIDKYLDLVDKKETIIINYNERLFRIEKFNEPSESNKNK